MSLLQNEEGPQAVYRALPSGSSLSTACESSDINTSRICTPLPSPAITLHHALFLGTFV